MRKRALKNGWATGLAALALLLAACGPGDDPANGGGGQTTPPPAGGGNGSGGGGPAPGGDDGPDLSRYTDEFQEVIRGAMEVGEVVWNVGSGNRTAEEEARISAAFEEEMGFPLRIRFHAPGPIAAVINQTVEEAAAGVDPEYDTIQGGAHNIRLLDEGDVVEETDWVALGIPEDQLSSDGRHVWLWDNIREIHYNTDNVSEDELPTSWEELLDPRWRGRIAGVAINSNYSVMGYGVGQEEFQEIVRRLVDEQDMALIPAISGAPPAVISGEFDFALAGSIEAERREGAPLDYLVFGQPVALKNYSVVMAGGPNPDGARALLWFLTQTDRGKDEMVEILGWSRRDHPGTDSFQLFGDGRGIDPPDDWWIDDIGPLNQAYGRLLGAQ